MAPRYRRGVSDVRERYRRIFGYGEGTERMQFFSDAVFAIAMTLLVLEIRLPEDAGEDLWAALVSIWPSFLAYALSFAIIGLNWVTHHRKFRYITRFDDALLRINLVFLFAVAFLPFPTSVIAEYGDQRAAAVLYAASVASLSLLQLWLWVHAYRAGLMEKEIDEGIYRMVRRNLLPVPIVFLGSIPFILIFGAFLTFAWFLLWPASIIVTRFGGRSATPAPARRSRGSAS
jgi:uncharacterized membrane protein